MKAVFATFTLAAALLGSGAIAQEKTEGECQRMHPTISSPVEYATCMYDSENAERSMRAAYSKLRSRVSGEYLLLLEKAQSAWIASRDSQCAYDAGGNPGSTGSDSSIIACIAGANRARTAYLLHDLQRWPIEKQSR
ncbi:lysozyme inhibitor LprI family protein [Sandaracinobacteroides hominis]|uniref:lysozyme inhibitor LprI family protein n=1 Tax=Sandaracinobacteroides hominis TaxID=2780086 RepID=UPI0018F4A36C|nr:lysozyme inhibitor LprI family protein [Sandaracinobacteroides hominis]